jgi:hypothetical protein
MASQELLNQLNQAFAQSSTFQLLPVEKQVELKQGFANVADEQVQQAIAELQKIDLKAAQNEQLRLANEQSHIEATKRLKAEMDQQLKIELKEAEIKDKADSAQEAENILASLAFVETEKPKSPKKFLGLF